MRITETSKTELAPVVRARAPFKLCFKLKKSSKYFRQGLDPDGKPELFELESISMTAGDYCFHGGPGGNYRRDDLDLFVQAEGGIKRI